MIALNLTPEAEMVVREIAVRRARRMAGQSLREAYGTATELDGLTACEKDMRAIGLIVAGSIAATLNKELARSDAEP